MKNVVAYALVFAALVFAFVLLRRNPGAVEALANSGGLATAPDQPAQVFNVSVGGYTAKNYALPVSGDSGITINRYSNCSFCLRTKPRLELPPGVVSFPSQQELITVTYNDQPFGGGG